MILINRQDAAQLIGITKNKLSEIIRNHKHLRFPAQASTGRMHLLYDQASTGRMHLLYDQDAVLKWAAETEYKTIKWTQPPKPKVFNKDKFDNDLVSQFLMPARSDRKFTKYGKTTVVHCIERDETLVLDRPMLKQSGNCTIYLDRSF